MATDEILQVVGAIYQTTLNVDEGDEREALQYIHDCAGMILDENEPSPDSLLKPCLRQVSPGPERTCLSYDGLGWLPSCPRRSGRCACPACWRIRTHATAAKTTETAAEAV